MLLLSSVQNVHVLPFSAVLLHVLRLLLLLLLVVGISLELRLALLLLSSMLVSAVLLQVLAVQAPCMLLGLCWACVWCGVQPAPASCLAAPVGQHKHVCQLHSQQNNECLVLHNSAGRKGGQAGGGCAPPVRKKGQGSQPRQNNTGRSRPCGIISVQARKKDNTVSPA
jgi:hypothetical protein